jgi:hypothetical protein
MMHDTVEVGNHNVIIDINPDDVPYTSMTINVFSKAQKPFHMMVVTSHELDNGFDETNFQFIGSGYPTVDIDYVDGVDGYNLILKSDSVQEIEYKISYQNTPKVLEPHGGIMAPSVARESSILPSSLNQPPARTSNPSSSLNQPPARTSNPIPALDYNSSRSNQPPARTSNPSSSLNQPPARTSNPSSSLNQPSARTSNPIPALDYNSSRSNQPTFSANNTTTSTPPKITDDDSSEKGSIPAVGIIAIVVSVTVLLVGGIFTFKFLNKNKGTALHNSKSPTLTKLENLAI